LVDDSAAGKNCVYSTDSSQYKISSIDTAWDDSRSSYVSTVTLVIPAAETAEKRTLTIRETSFLRDRIEGKADFDVNAGRTIELECDALADALKTRENSDGTLTVTGYRGDLRELHHSGGLYGKTRHGDRRPGLFGCGLHLGNHTGYHHRNG